MLEEKSVGWDDTGRKAGAPYTSRRLNSKGIVSMPRQPLSRKSYVSSIVLDPESCGTMNADPATRKQNNNGRSPSSTEAEHSQVAATCHEKANCDGIVLLVELPMLGAMCDGYEPRSTGTGSELN